MKGNGFRRAYVLVLVLVLIVWNGRGYGEELKSECVLRSKLSCKGITVSSIAYCLYKYRYPVSVAPCYPHMLHLMISGKTISFKPEIKLGNTFSPDEIISGEPYEKIKDLLLVPYIISKLICYSDSNGNVYVGVELWFGGNSDEYYELYNKEGERLFRSDGYRKFIKQLKSLHLNRYKEVNLQTQCSQSVIKK